MTPVDVLVRLILGAILGGLIGWERESHRRPAGLRTHVLVSLGATLLTVVSQQFFFMYRGITTADPARIAAQIVSGIGFLGAGTIMREGVSIRGLTTAASLWVAAAIGLAVGAGSYMEALATTGITLVALVYLARLERRLAPGKRQVRLGLVVRDRPGQLGAVASLLGQRQVDIRHVDLAPAGDDDVRLELVVVLPAAADRGRLVEELKAIDGVLAVQLQE